MVKDISKQTVVVLAVLAIMVSLLGTFTVINGISSMEVTIVEPVEPKAELRVSVVDSDREPLTSSSSGQVSLDIATT